MEKYEYTRAADPAYIESLYAQFREDPSSVDKSWHTFFGAYEFFLHHKSNGSLSSPVSEKSTAVRDLVQAYRSRGHLLSTTNPVRKRLDRKPRLALKDFGLSESDLKKSFAIGPLFGSTKARSLEEIHTLLKTYYTGNIGFQYMHISDPEIIDWFKKICEEEYPRFNPSIDRKTRILEKLNEAVVFENFLHTKYVGQKRFSLEGGETAIPALDTAINHASSLGVEFIMIGMAHRGRLNILANVLGKTYDQIFREFEGTSMPEQTMGDGDVKYHMGYSSLVETPLSKEVTLKLSPNPSHLETVASIVIGHVRAKIDEEYKDPKKVLSVIIHGDAAVAGQGLVYEIAQMSKLPAYDTGGSLHFVINNQIGFTTDFEEARSSIYCTDVAKIIDAPILHVNGDDPEAVVFCMEVAVAFRQKFGRDIYVDMVCYRKHGHNESDEPKFTQPFLYKAIATHPNPREVYTQKLTAGKQIDVQLAKNMDQAFRKLLQDRLHLVKQTPHPSLPPGIMEKAWQSLRSSTPQDFDSQPKTTISAKVIDQVAKALTYTPKGFHTIRQIDKVLAQRKDMFFKDKVLNWASAELLAYGSLLCEGKTVRLVGQDSQRGTFSHRHAVLRDAETNTPYNSLKALSQKDSHFFIYNSLLSEYGALGFEFGYSLATPDALVIWEAQFGDFANGAQVIIDQFLTTSYTKWQRMSGIVLLLPHGYEGQGPEHSNARPERFLEISSGYNMFVCNITTPANFFHMLRRQLRLPFRMPAVVMSPKSLFRHPKVLSPLTEFTKGNFLPVIDDPEVQPKEVRKVLLCTGKIYYDLYQARSHTKKKEVAILRLEQLHPFPHQLLKKILSRYTKMKTYYWVQEEPKNMGAWTYLLRTTTLSLQLISRRAAASPATGYYKLHLKEQQSILDEALR